MGAQMREPLYIMWSIQESLLQQYRAMAVSLMGLISAGILVAVSFISSNWMNYDGLLAGKQSISASNFPKVATELVLFIMLVALIYLGFSASISFRKITKQRAEIITFFQNLILAEDSGNLEKLCDLHNLPYPVDPLILLRHRSNQKMVTLEFERFISKGNFRSFETSVNSTGSPNQDQKVRHSIARSFLATKLFKVFNIFFSLCALYTFFVLIHILI